MILILPKLAIVRKPAGGTENFDFEIIVVDEEVSNSVAWRNGLAGVRLLLASLPKRLGPAHARDKLKTGERTMRYEGLIIMVLLAVGMPAAACDIPMSKVADYVAGSTAGKVAFVGSIVSSTSQQSGGVLIEDVVVRVGRIFGTGQFPRTLPVLNRISGGANPCATGDLAAKAGEQWLIFGHRDAERFYPDLQLSRKLTKGVVAPALLRQLGASK